MVGLDPPYALRRLNAVDKTVERLAEGQDVGFRHQDDQMAAEVAFFQHKVNLDQQRHAGLYVFGFEQAISRGLIGDQRGGGEGAEHAQQIGNAAHAGADQDIADIQQDFALVFFGAGVIAITSCSPAMLCSGYTTMLRHGIR